MKTMLTLLALACLAAPVARADDSVDATPADGAIKMAPAKAKKTKKSKSTSKADEPVVVDKKAAAPKKVTKDDGLVIEDLKVGSGMEAKEGSRVRVHYKGTFMNGKVFDQNVDQSIDKIEPFTLDAGHLIAGWVEGIPGMKVGGKRKLMVPFKLAYGEGGTPDGSIPPRADLNFEVELLKVE